MTIQRTREINARGEDDMERIQRAFRKAELVNVTPAYVHAFERFAAVIGRVRTQVIAGGEADLDLDDVAELETAYKTCLEIEGQMRRWMKEAQ